MFQLLGKLLRPEPVVVGFSSKRIYFRNYRTDQSWSDVPAILIGLNDDGQKFVSAVGTAALRESGNAQYPFGHPRTIVSDWLQMLKIIEYGLAQIDAHPSKIVRSEFVYFVAEELEGGLTEMELRVLRELLLSVGARAVHFWPSTNEPTPSEIRSKAYIDASAA